MAIRISIYALGTDDERIADVTLPANKNMIIDAMDKAKIFGETFSHIMECEDCRWTKDRVIMSLQC